MAIEKGDCGLNDSTSSISLMTGHWPSVPCLSWYGEMFTILTGGGVTGLPLVTPTRKSKNLGLLHVVWHSFSALIPIIGKKKKSQEATTRGSCLSQMVPTVTLERICSPLLLLPTVFSMLKGFPFGNLETSRNDGDWALVSNRTKKDYVFLLSQ